MNKSQRTNGGYLLIINALVFLAVSFFVIGAAAGPLVASNRATDSFVDSAEAFMLASSAAEEALYKMKSQMSIGSSETLTLGDHSAEISVATGLDDKTITVTADVESYVRALEIRVAESVGTSFNYGIQVGQGGFDMAGGAGIYGNVYSNGDIVGSGGPFITGGATVANRSEPVADQSNSGVMPPVSSVSFGGNGIPQDLAQSFTVSTTTPVTAVRFYMRRSSTAWMNDITVRLTTNSSGKPSGTTLASANLGHAQITTAYNYLTVPFSSTAVLTPGTTYWIVLDTGTTWGSFYTVGASQATYGNGLARTGSWANGNGGTWADTSPAGLDLYFDIYVGGETGRISGVTVGQSGGDAWAHRIESSTIHGTAYCQSSQSTNKACDTSRPDPVEQPMPISDGNIDAWKAEAAAGGETVGNVSYGGAQNVSLGPQKIVGNLTVGAGATLTVTGSLWVTGNISLSGGAVIRLAGAYGTASGVIVTDGRVTASGGGQFQGNGQAGSYILVVSTSECPTGCGSNPAIHVSGGTGAVVLNAQKGTLRFSGGAQAKQATAHKIVMDGGTAVHYETGLADMTFTSGPSGSWELHNWTEI